ncbi:MAG: chorismate mutase [Candidatus Cloacimonadales bacterium]
MNLETIRRKIDEIDAEIIKLLGKRMELAVATKHLKTGVEDLSREAVIISKLTVLAKHNNLDAEFIKRVYKEIFNESKKRQIAK